MSPRIFLVSLYVKYVYVIKHFFLCLYMSIVYFIKYLFYVIYEHCLCHQEFVLCLYKHCLCHQAFVLCLYMNIVDLISIFSVYYIYIWTVFISSRICSMFIYEHYLRDQTFVLCLYMNIVYEIKNLFGCIPLQVQEYCKTPFCPWHHFIHNRPSFTHIFFLNMGCPAHDMFTMEMLT